MWQQLKLVALSYITRKLLWLFPGILLLLKIPSLIFQFVAADRPSNAGEKLAHLLVNSFIQAYAAFILGAHLKQQFANPRARLLPGFCGPHLIVAMTLFLGFVGWSVLPAAFMPEISLIGFAAITLHIGVLGLWAGCSPGVIGITVLILTMGGLPTLAVGRALVMEIAMGSEPILAWSLFSAHVASLMLLLNHLMKLSEDDPDYAKVQQFNAWDMRATTQRTMIRNQGTVDNWLVNAIAVGASRQLERATDVSASTSDRRIKLFGMGDNSPSPLYLNLVIIGLLEVGLLLAGGREGIRDVQSFREALSIPIVFTFALTWGQWLPWLMRWPRLGYESLRPVSRLEWVRENGAAIARRVLWNQASAIGMQLLIVAVLLPDYFTDVGLWSALIWFVGSQVLLFGLCAWLASYGSMLVVLLTMPFCIAMISAPWLTATLMKDLIGIPLSLGASMGMTLLGAVVCKTAYRRWCQIDLP